MDPAVHALRAILADPRLGAEEGAEIVRRATSAGVDPLDYCIRRLGVPQRLAFRRAADWAGLAFADRLPSLDGHGAAFPRLDALASFRALAVPSADADAGSAPVYCAPRLDELVRLSAADPALRARIVLAPPPALRAHMLAVFAPALMDAARQTLARRWPRASAHLDLSLAARIGFGLVLLALVMATILAPLMGPLPLVLLAVGFATAPALPRLVAVLSPQRPPPEPPPVPEDELPLYTILLPLRDEAHMVPQLHRAMVGLDYPPEKLDIVFVVEADCAATLTAVAPLLEDARFSLVAVPPAAPRTKPKAMNYALPFARGALIVVYDAEDRPEPDQLRRAAARFRADPGLACLQAELVTDNGAENPLTALYAGEYAGLFGLVLPTLARWGVPVPLGGTSNHFPLAVLRAAGGWDSFNVTEDADLGLRLARMGARVETLASATFEEAPATVRAWTAQRARWIKGWMQTLIVHNRQPFALQRELGWRAFLFFEIVVFGMILAPLVHMGFLIAAALGFLLARPAEPGWLTLAYFLVFVVGNGAALAVHMTGLVRRGERGLLAVQLLLPFYWMLLAAATLRALFDLLVRPFHWAKTAHRPTGGASHPVQGVPEAASGD